MDHVPPDAGARITRPRAGLGLKQTELARLLGVSNVTVNRWAHGRTTPAAAVMDRIAAAEGGGVAALGPEPRTGATTVVLRPLPIPPTSFVRRTEEFQELGRRPQHRHLRRWLGEPGARPIRAARRSSACRRS